MYRTEMTLDDSWLAYGDNIQFRIQEAMDHTLRLMARTNLESVRTVRFIRERWTAGKPDWHNAKWARFLRRLGKKVQLPEPLKVLINSSWWRCEYSEEDWPEEMLDKILIQMAYLEMQGQEPIAICCGPMGEMSLQEVAYAYCVYRVSSSWDAPTGMKLYGLPIRVIPWLAKDEVMVV